jgi:arylsulfatase A-like enzyme
MHRNVLLILVDQMSAHAMSCVGNADVRTPNLHRLAGQGTCFPWAYSTHPLCAPFRAAMVTGRYPHQIDCMKNRMPGPADEHVPASMGHRFRDAGYTTAYAGKWHVPTHDLSRPEDQEKWAFDCICGMNDDHLVDACTQFLQRKHDKPFLLVASFDNPHNICEHGRSQSLPWGEVDDVPTREYPNLPANFAPSPYEPSLLDVRRDREVARQYRYTPDRWRRYRHVYYRLVEKVDAEVGRLLDRLDDAGLADSTTVVFTSDHGDHNGAHGLVQKSTSYDESARVPFLLRGSGIAAGATDDRFVNAGIDLLPTLLHAAGLDTDDDLPGVAMTSDTPGRDAIFLEGVFDTTDFAWRAVRTGDFIYTLYDRGDPRESLYDLATDPGEMVNLAVESRHDELLTDLRRRLYEWCLATGDNFGNHYTHDQSHPVIPGLDFGPVPPREGCVLPAT